MRSAHRRSRELKQQFDKRRFNASRENKNFICANVSMNVNTSHSLWKYYFKRWVYCLKKKICLAAIRHVPCTPYRSSLKTIDLQISTPTCVQMSFAISFVVFDLLLSNKFSVNKESHVIDILIKLHLHYYNGINLWIYYNILWIIMLSYDPIMNIYILCKFSNLRFRIDFIHIQILI